MLNLAVLLEDSVRNVPDRVAVACGPTRLTYAELNAKASQVAGALAARGISPGDRVALSCPNLPYFPIVYYGILKAGATVVPLNILLTEREIAYHLEDSAAKAYFCFEGTAELPVGQAGRAAFDRTESCEHFVLLTAHPDATSPSPDTETLADFAHRQPAVFASAATGETDTAVILYTSDAMGQPKGAELTHSNGAQRASRERAVRPAPARRAPSPASAVPLLRPDRADERGVRRPRDDRAAAPVRRRDGTGTHAGRAGDLVRGRPDHVSRAAELRGAGRFDTEKIAARMRIAVSGGAALPVEVMRRFEERFAVPILEGYGLSETSPVATFNRVDRPRRPGSIGLPVWGVEVQIVRDDGWRPTTVSQGRSRSAATT